ncbi:binding-protein-dependent transport systems inner membrane component [Beutenbergia cavernae DSM 12333]|uniref:Binding-protein-dependent transport systems inner membrane component n=1 Tax=Beutenbergia cavernae (strain ATCC BAA-8 / DSM 12333 / CCUG 43141 / JCM 11478 / NBRC 16432 / NCIMB 13614 / HKI 0122) TaxID=471853 RepID=C5C363_BEUC1|nr:sugar ABC transporter permease [Beutenbergia cavernae]ACQ79762.1 binding-protein-dependent transport systems inner membrane component [Beutenbergia cavernae DSM 12333]
MAHQDVIAAPRPPATGAREAADRRRGRRRRDRREYALFALLIFPNAVLILTFEYWPVLYNAFLSMTSWNMISGTPQWVGFANYVDLLTSPNFHRVLLNTAVFTGAVVIGSVVLGLLLALLFNQKLHLRGVVRTAAFSPYVISGAAVATLWLFLFDPNYGLSRLLFSLVGADSPRWVTDAQWAMPALIIAYLWKGMGFVAIIYLAGLQGLPEEYDEAARIDGAGRWAIFRRITLPLLSPVTFFVMVITIIGTFQAYDLIAVMTGGGPGIATTTLSWFIYERAFKASDAGGAAAAAMILFVILLAVTALQNAYSQRKVHYQ